MDLVEEAFFKLYPNKKFRYSTEITYSSRFKPYNANLKKYENKLILSLSKEWKSVNKEIVIGLVQILLLKLFKDSKDTLNIQLYNTFIKNLHLSAPKYFSNPILEESFNRVNKKYFYNLIDKPNLKWGSYSKRELGSYNYHTDTITISSIFKNADTDILDYIMYHEILHKKLKFKNKAVKTYHHTSEFRKLEKKFENYKEIEQKISKLIKSLGR